MMTGDSEQVLNRAVDREESLNLCRRFEATHLAFLLPGVLVRDLNAVVFVLPGSMADGSKNVSVHSRIASLVGDKLQRWPLLVLQDLAKEALGSSLVSVARDQDIEDIAILVHRSPKIMTFAADADEHPVDVPDVAESTLSPPQSSGVRGSELPAPRSNGFVGYGDATLGEKVLDIAKTQREPMVQPNRMADDLGRKAVTSIQGFHRSIVADRPLT